MNMNKQYNAMERKGVKKALAYFPLCLVALGSFLISSCSNDDDLDEKSVIQNSLTEENDFDKWLKENFVNPYNIEFLYRYDDNETDLNYYNVPADYHQAIEYAHIVKYCGMEAYDRVAGVEFTRAYFPKMFYATGEFEYNNNGTMILGTAESGKKIFLSGTNHLDAVLTGSGDELISAAYLTTLENRRYILNELFLKTIYHEFTHILNQTKDYSEDFQQITGSLYINDAWSTAEGEDGYLGRGFITDYSQKEAREDFAEVLSTYITNTPEQWATWMQEATSETPSGSTDGATLINQKLDIVRTYMQDQWNINIDDLRSEVLKRMDDVLKGYVNLTDLTVNN